MVRISTDDLGALRGRDLWPLWRCGGGVLLGGTAPSGKQLLIPDLVQILLQKGRIGLQLGA